MNKIRNFTILTVSLLSLNAVEEVAVYKLRHVIQDDHLRTLILLLMFGFGFVVVAGILVPWFKDVYKKLHNRSKRKAGIIGVLFLYAVLFTAFYMLYHLIYTRGPQYLLPVVWR